MSTNKEYFDDQEKCLQSAKSVTFANISFVLATNTLFMAVEYNFSNLNSYSFTFNFKKHSLSAKNTSVIFLENRGYSASQTGVVLPTSASNETVTLHSD